MRYSRNMNMISEAENKQLSGYTVAVIGCGGLGGYVIEMLSRLGVGHIICCDGDVFDQSNLNRQLVSTESNLGLPKALEAKQRVHEINSDIKVTVYQMFLTQNNAEKILKDCDVVVDALDQVATKLLLENMCRQLEIPLIYGAIGGWYGQVTTVLPGDDTISFIYQNSQKGIEKDLGNPSFTPATIASIQVAECLKVLLSRDGLLRKRILMIDLLNHDYEIIELN